MWESQKKHYKTTKETQGKNYTKTKSLWKNKNKSRWRFELNYKPHNPKI